MGDTIHDAVVVGGGLSGLAAATLVADGGKRDVVLLERASCLGGRARTHSVESFAFNTGAHALYRGGPAERVLAALGVRWTGTRPETRGAAVVGQRIFRLPASFGGILSTRLLSWSAKLDCLRMMAMLGRVDPAAIADVPLERWLATQTSDPTARALLAMFVRLTTFAHAPALLSAGAAVAQLRYAMARGVVYIDDGWQTLVDGAAAAAERAGVVVRTAAHAVAAEPMDVGWRVRTGDGACCHARVVIVAAGPSVARSLVRSRALDAWASGAIPAKVACLDVALRSDPARPPARPRLSSAHALDRPLYYSVHSDAARLAPSGSELVSTMKYLSPFEEMDAARDEAELEAWLDTLRPGWRDSLVVRRSLPAMTASHAIPCAEHRGTLGRPGPAVPDAPGAFVVGDWVGREGILLDAALASAEDAAREAVSAIRRDVPPGPRGGSANARGRAPAAAITPPSGAP